MNQSIHQLMQLVLQGIAWVLKTIELLWDWSWAQIMGMFNMSWSNLPAWKMVVGALAIAILAGILVTIVKFRSDLRLGRFRFRRFTLRKKFTLTSLDWT